MIIIFTHFLSPYFFILLLKNSTKTSLIILPCLFFGVFPTEYLCGYGRKILLNPPTHHHRRRYFPMVRTFLFHNLILSPFLLITSISLWINLIYPHTSIFSFFTCSSKNKDQRKTWSGGGCEMIIISFGISTIIITCFGLIYSLFFDYSDLMITLYLLSGVGVYFLIMILLLGGHLL